MEAIEEVQRNSLLKKFKGHNQFGDIADALSKEHCYRIRVYNDDFDNILINSSNEDRELSWPEYPTLKEVIGRIAIDTSFFGKTRRNGMLSGTRVKELYDEFNRDGSKPKHFFIVDRDNFPGMNERASFYVRDGMHHLVAYGLATQLREESFPIIGYYCTNRRDRVFGKY